MWMITILLPWRSFKVQQNTLLLKITTHVAVWFMSWMQDIKATYMEYQSGNPYHVQGYILDTHHSMQDQ